MEGEERRRRGCHGGQRPGGCVGGGMEVIYGSERSGTFPDILFIHLNLFNNNPRHLAKGRGCSVEPCLHY